MRALVAAAFGCAATGALAVDFINGLALPGDALDASSGTTDVTNIDLDAPGAIFTKVVKNPTAFIDLANYSARVPAPSAYAMLAAGLLGLGAALRRRR